MNVWGNRMMASSPALAREGSPETTVALVDELRLMTDGLAALLSSDCFGIRVVIRAGSWPELVGHPGFPAAVTVLDPNLRDDLHLATRIQVLRSAGSQVVVMSGRTDASSISRAMRAGALGFVPKTDGADELVAAIRAAAEGRRHLRKPLAAAVDRLEESGGPSLGEREHRAISLYSTGRSIRQVAAEMRTTEETIKSYIKRARRKYRGAGIELGTRLLLRQHGIREGWVEPD
jgi:DNA-binding NarL/FixJ family response regulator